MDTFGLRPALDDLNHLGSRQAHASAPFAVSVWSRQWNDAFTAH